MPRRAFVLLLILIVLAWPDSATAGKRKPATLGSVHYHVELPNPHRQYVHVRMEVLDARADRTEVAMPAWAPGSYLVRDFGKHVYEVEATTREGKALAVERLDKQTWRVANRKEGFVLDYQVFADELSVRTSYLDDRVALLNGTSVFMYVVGETRRAATLSLVPPSGWDVATGLESVGRDDGLLGWKALTYDELVDSPLLLGDLDVRRFTVAGTDVEFVFTAPSGTNADVARIARDAEKITRAFSRIMNGLPMKRYVYLMVADRAGGGGLEHHDSTAMIVQPFAYGEESGYQGTRRLMAHEFFHLWNVKHIHDRVLGPFDYSRETYSNLLWFHEGFTETMETRALLRAGLIDADEYLEAVAAAWTGYMQRPGRNHTPIAELSREAWIKAYQPESNHSATVVSYYDKGNLIGICLDLELRLRGRAQGREATLDGVFRRIWARRDPAWQSIAIDLDDIVAAASEEAGEDMRWFFDRYVLRTEELPLPELMTRAGFVVESTKLGEAAGAKGAWTGMRGKTSVEAIEPNSPADLAGLMIGDEPLAVERERVRSVEEANARVGESSEPVKIELFRRDRLIEREIRATRNPHTLWRFARPKPEQDVDLELARLRELWLLEHLRG